MKVEDLDVETVMVRNGARKARYDAGARWVKLRFTAKDGPIVEYVCQNCEAVNTVTTPRTEPVEAPGGNVDAATGADSAA